MNQERDKSCARNSSTVNPACRIRDAQSANRQLLVLGNRQIDAKTRFCHYYVAADFPATLHPVFWKALTASFPEIFASRATASHGDEDFRLSRLSSARCSLLVLSP